MYTILLINEYCYNRTINSTILKDVKNCLNKIMKAKNKRTYIFKYYNNNVL